MSEIRTRIAPSPTGAPHIGTAYIALHNRALAKSLGGKFLLRIEDTDQVRSTLESEQQILDTLRWLGLEWDEGPDVGGPHGPYRQSERLHIYKEHVQKLLDTGHAYYCFCSKERLDDLRAKQMEAKTPPGYDGHCRDLPMDQALEKIEAGEACVIRLKIPKEGQTVFFDEVRKNEISFENSGIDDQVLMKTDGFPTYHLANVVDDHLMAITHVMRGEEWISSTPKHILLYKAFGWEPPKFFHLALLRNADKSKISKRKNPTSLLWFKARGYTKTALTNFLGLMAHSRADGRELFSVEELNSEYDTNRISSTAPIFDFAKLDKFNTHYLTHLSDQEFADYQITATNALIDFARPLLAVVRERSKCRGDLDRWTNFLFEREFDYKVESFRLKKMDQESALNFLKALGKALQKETSLNSAEDYKALCEKLSEELLIDTTACFMLMRVVMMKEQESLPLFPVMAFLGVDICIKRVKEASQFLRSNWPVAKKS